MNRRQKFWAKFENLFPAYNNAGYVEKVVPKAETPEEARKIFRSALTDYVAQGWKIEIENEFDAVISRKRTVRWVGKFLLFLLLFLIWFPLALFYLVIAIIMGVTARPKTMRVYIDEEGYVQTA